MTTRRTFLSGCSVLATAAALDPGSLLAAVTPARPGLSAFARAVGTTFHLQSRGRPQLGLRLAEARPLPLANPAAIEHQFSLLFTGPVDLPLTQDTYTFEHTALGRMAMFLVPVMRQKGSHQSYEAVFNRYPGPVA